MTSNKIHSAPQASLFVGHGAPDIILLGIPARQFLKKLGSHLPEPRGIVVISAHWETSDLQMTSPTAQETIYDFYGWPSEIYGIEYHASGANWLNERLASALSEKGYPVSIGSRPGLDHGAWVPLSLMYPEANIPIVQLSLLRSASPEQHFRIGRALDGMRKEGVLILGSGGLVHNLRTLKSEGSPPDHWAQSFDRWLFKQLESRALQELFSYASKAENAKLAHPTNEHLMPLFVSMGAGWSDGYTQQIHHSFSYGNLSMSSYSFARPDARKSIT